MSDDARPEVKAKQTLLDKNIPKPLLNLITAVLTMLKNAWSMENAQTGIQIYGDMED